MDRKFDKIADQFDFLQSRFVGMEKEMTQTNTTMRAILRIVRRNQEDNINVKQIAHAKSSDGDGDGDSPKETTDVAFEKWFKLKMKKARKKDKTPINTGRLSVVKVGLPSMKLSAMNRGDSKSIFDP